MGWDDVKKQVEARPSQKMFLRLINDGDRVVVAFLGEPFATEVYWIPGGRSEKFDPTKHDPSKSRLQIKINVYLPEAGIVQIWQVGPREFRQIEKLRDKYGLGNWTFEIVRNGAKGDMKTSYSILPEAMITDDQRATLAGLTLHDLCSDYSAEAEDQAVARAASNATGFSEAEALTGSREGIVDIETAREIAARLKLVPRSAAHQFLQAFGIGRISDLRTKDTAAALAMIAAFNPEKKVDDVIPF